MRILLVGLLILIVSLGYTTKAAADLPQDILGCYAIQNNAERLDCYDTVSKYYKTRPNSARSKPLTKTAPLISPPTVQTLTTAKTKPKVKSPTKENSAVDDFGQIRKDDQLESIQSRIVGKFGGWKKGLKITLENGQVWKVANNAKGYRKLTNPAITISRGFFNSFNAKVEGLTAMAKVRRIK